MASSRTMVLELLLRRGPQRLSDLAEATGMDTAVVATALRSLRLLGVVQPPVKTGVRGRHGGSGATVYAFTTAAALPQRREAPAAPRSAVRRSYYYRRRS